MEKILGIDTGTNSLGWAIVEKNEDCYELLDKGVDIFQEGVKIEKGIESSKASERTEHRATRIRYYRIKLRKIRLLRILSDNHLCPPLTKNDLSLWRLKKVYPQNELFMNWQRTDDVDGVNPYKYRYICLTKKLDMNDLTQRYMLGRALYHLIQRRGFMSNRKDSSEEVDGKVKECINDLSKEMSDAGFEYLGEYFYKLYNEGKKIRNHYTARKEHYLKEFKAICEKQQLDKDLVDRLEKAIFYQRPLKSQKGQVGMCTFEKGKAKCPASHPLYEEFRMLSFINNIKIRTPKDDNLRSLNADEKEKIKHLFYRKSKKSFNFEDIAKEIAGKNNYGYYKTESHKPYLFNYYMDTSVSGSVVTAQLIDIFGNDWLGGISEVYTLAKGKTEYQIMNDIWHALYFYSDVDKLRDFAHNRLQLDDENAKRFSKISMPNEYAALSLKAIRKILPYLNKGLIYPRAVFLANLCNIVPKYIWEIKESREAVIDNVTEVMDNYDSNIDSRTLDVCIKDYLKKQYNIDDNMLLKLYHPSMMDAYPKIRPNEDGIYQLGSPRISSVRNPMAMRSMYRMRKLVNQLLKEKKIDENTIIHIEFARELNDANKRKAIADINRANEKDKEACRKEIAELYKEETGKDIEPTDVEILKFQLWNEQNHICLYTGQTINISDFIGANPKYDIEHTIPQSAGGDSTKMNLTLCQSKYNRDVKGTKLPSQLPDHEAILQRIQGWKDKYEDLDKQVHKYKHLSTSTKEQKDLLIQKRHKLSLERDYWRGKYERFIMTEVPEGFSRRQGTDISVISRYARLYLKSVFHQVYTVKGLATSDFRKIWGIQEEYSKKQRVNHTHHCIDAIVIACIGPNEYAKLAQYYHNEENHKWYGTTKGNFKKPWDGFVNDIKKVQDEILVSHQTQDNMPKQAKRYIKVSGGKKELSKGDTARASLHNDKYYGAIQNETNIRYVLRKKISDLKETDVKNIVDDTVRGIVEDAIRKHGFKSAISETIWMNEEKHIPINKVRCFTPTVTMPLNIRQHRDLSPKKYKQQYHVVNDRNYMLAIYIGTDIKGKEKRDFELVNNLQASAFFKRSNEKEATDNQIVPLSSSHDYALAYTLKIGTMVILYENTPEEIWEGGISEIDKRLYKVTGLSSMRISEYSYGTITLLHHQEASQSKLLKQTNGPYKINDKYRPVIFLYHSQINALIEGVDFNINELGEIKRLR